MRLRSRWVGQLVLATALVGLCGGCSMFKFKGQVVTWKQVGNERTVKVREVDKLEDMPGALNEAFSELGETTAELVKKLTDVPPAGEVKLTDLNPALAKFEGNTKADFLSLAKKKPDSKQTFQYVQIGVPAYDQFFKTAMEIYAITFQTRQTVYRIRELSAALLNEDVDASAELKSVLKRATEVQQPSEEQSKLVAELTELQQMAIGLASTVPTLVQKVQTLIATGQQLILSAPTSITNPKVVLHLDLIKKGLTESVSVIAESGKDLGAMAKLLVGLDS